MTGLFWNQVYAMAIAQPGRKFRRAQWQHWLLYDDTTETWSMDYSEQPTVDTPPALLSLVHIVQAFEFGIGEFNATDWTDEDWNVTTGTCAAGYSWDSQSQACVLNGTFDNVGTTVTGGTTTTTTDSNGVTTTTTTGSDGSSSSTSTPPPPSSPTAPPGGGGAPPGPPGDPKTPTAKVTAGSNFTPTVVLDLMAPVQDGPGCYILPPGGNWNPGDAVEPTVQATMAAAPGIALFQVECRFNNKVQTANVAPGDTYTFSFPGTVLSLGGSWTAYVTAYSDTTVNGGGSWTGKDTKTVAKYCPPWWIESLSFTVTGYNDITNQYIVVGTPVQHGTDPNPRMFPIFATLSGPGVAGGGDCTGFWLSNSGTGIELSPVAGTGTFAPGTYDVTGHVTNSNGSVITGSGTRDLE